MGFIIGHGANRGFGLPDASSVLMPVMLFGSPPAFVRPLFVQTRFVALPVEVPRRGVRHDALLPRAAAHRLDRLWRAGFGLYFVPELEAPTPHLGPQPQR